MDASRRLFLKLMGVGAGALATGKIPEAKEKGPELPIPSKSVEGYDFSKGDLDRDYVSRVVRIFPHHGKTGIDVTKPLSVLHLHRYLQELLDDSYVNGDDLLDITKNNFSWRHTDTIIEFDSKYCTISPRSFKNLRNSGVIYGHHKFFCVERLGMKQGHIRVNGMPFVDCQLLHCKKIHHFTHKPFINRPWQDMNYSMIGEREEYGPYRYVIPV